MKTCAIMQPYLFPYIGYYQLVYAADCFVFYDDVTFMKQSYINRNSILVNKQALRFSVPVMGASSNTLIKDLHYSPTDKLLKTIQQAYSKAPYFNDVMGLISSVLNHEQRNIAKLNGLSITKTLDYLGIEKKVVYSSEIDYERYSERDERLISLVNIHDCEHYINSPGGRSLYDKAYFASKGIKLSFIESEIIPYKQPTKDFIPYLSMIDILMNCSKKSILEMLTKYELS